MTAYLIAHIRVKDPTKWQQYVDSVAETLAPYQAEVVFRGKRAAVLIGEHPYSTVAVLRFSDSTVIQHWFDSEAYRALSQVRDEAAEVIFISYNI